jgi:hypothetical protein
MVSPQAGQEQSSKSCYYQSNQRSVDGAHERFLVRLGPELVPGSCPNRLGLLRTKRLLSLGAAYLVSS